MSTMTEQAPSEEDVKAVERRILECQERVIDIAMQKRIPGHEVREAKRLSQEIRQLQVWIVTHPRPL